MRTLVRASAGFAIPKIPNLTGISVAILTYRKANLKQISKIDIE
jgi:hypothetical protein